MRTIVDDRRRAARYLLARGWKRDDRAPVNVAGQQAKWSKDGRCYSLRNAVAAEQRLRSPVIRLRIESEDPADAVAPGGLWAAACNRFEASMQRIALALGRAAFRRRLRAA